jgi:hypothetical protein
MSITEDLLGFLASTFPGSTIDDGYFFIVIRGGAERFVRYDKLQEAVDRITDGRCWLVTVNVDPRDLVEPDRIEQRTVDYNPDWNVHEPMPQWIVDVSSTRVDISALIARRKEARIGAYAFISADRRVAFQLPERSLIAASRSEMERFGEGLEACFED